MFVLDTDHISFVQHRDDPLCDSIMRQVFNVGENVYATIISFQEQALGWNSRLSRAKQRDEVIAGYRRYETMLDFFASAQLLPYDDGAAGCFDEINAARTRVGLMDLRIAAIVLANDMTLVTRNRRFRADSRPSGRRLDSITRRDWIVN